jgi:hypothetical protein
MSAAAENHSRKVLGKAVHENAIRRLHELWPEAEVLVKYYQGIIVGNRITMIVITEGAKEVVAWSRCVASDQYDRKYGVRLAFQRALAKVRVIEYDPAPEPIHETLREGMP